MAFVSIYDNFITNFFSFDRFQLITDVGKFRVNADYVLIDFQLSFESQCSGKSVSNFY